MLSTPWEQRKNKYDFVIIGSGYGGAIAAARLAGANLTPKPSVCILERGKERQPGEFPETLAGVVGEARSSAKFAGTIRAVDASGYFGDEGIRLGGTSLINANVAIEPDQEVFEQFHWPSAITLDALRPYYKVARDILAPSVHPRAMQLGKVQALNRRAQEMGTTVEALTIAVNPTIKGEQSARRGTAALQRLRQLRLAAAT